MAVPMELDEQHWLTQWLDLKKILYFAVPNETNLVSKLKGYSRIAFFKQRKYEGVKKGVQDLVVFLDGCILFVEMKRTKGSKTSDEQLGWKEKVNSYHYARAEICKGWLEAKEFIECHST